MDGYQAVAYARIRYVGNADYQRTERQREVLEKIMQKCSSLSVTELSSLADAVLPAVTHNIDQSTLLSLIGQLPTILSYEIVQSRVPYDGMFTNREKCWFRISLPQSRNCRQIFTEVRR